MALRIPVIECVAGTTITLTWISSGSTASPISAALWSGSETLISSLTATASGNGHYYALMDVPTSGGNYVNEWFAIVGVNTYRSRQLLLSHRLEVD